MGIKIFLLSHCLCISLTLLLVSFLEVGNSLPSSDVKNSVDTVGDSSNLAGISVSVIPDPIFDLVNNDDDEDDDEEPEDASLYFFNYATIPEINDEEDLHLDNYIKNKESQHNKNKNKLYSSKNANNNPEEVNGTNDRNFWEWIQQIIGITTTTQKPMLEKPEHCDPCQCGMVNRKRIVGGHETEVNQYPWMTLLLYNNRFYCGGSLINDRYILTAAHCTTGLNPEKITIRLMEHDRTTEDESEVINRKVRRIVRHPRYSNRNYNNDIALLHMDMPVTLKSPLRPVCMPTKGKSFSGYDGVVTGWGATQESGPVATKLQEVIVPIMSNAQCRETSYGKDRITDNMLCAGYPEGEKDSCQGDSGGPLHVLNATTSIHQVVGIVSWGEGCAQADKPGVYTRVNRYLTWIKSNTVDACYC